jgi:outer membrane protein OmpA-like peptidoglycan-associated protein
MSETIFIPGLRDSVKVKVEAIFGAGPDVMKTSFDNGLNETFKLAEKKRQSRLVIVAQMMFPHCRDDQGGGWFAGYPQVVTGVFDNIIESDGNLQFSDTQISLQGEPIYVPPNSLSNPFRYIDGTAWVSGSANPRIPVIKIKLTIGSQDVIVTSRTVSTTDATSKTTKGGKTSFDPKDILPKDIQEWIPLKVVDIDVKVERADPINARSSTSTRTLGQLWQQRVWTLSLQLPEIKPPAPPPGPFGLPEPFTFYFETGKSNADRYRSPLSGMSDQIKGLQEYLEAIDKTYKLENIDSIAVIGYASGLGDTINNIHLSTDRANYVANLLSTLNIYKVPPNKITPKGERINASDKDDNPRDRRAELRVTVKGSARH